MDMAEAGEASSLAGQRSGETTHVFFVAVSEQWKLNTNGKRLRNETSEPVSALEDWRSRMEQTVRQQADEVTQLHLTINSMATMVEAHTACEEAKWRGMNKWQEDMQTKWDEHHKHEVLWGKGIADMTSEVLAKARGNEAAQALGARETGRDETPRQEAGDLEASRHAGAKQDDEPVKGQPQQQPKGKPKLQQTLQPEQRHEPKPKPRPIPIQPRRWETVQPRMQSQMAPAGPGPAPTTGLSMAERHLISRRDLSVPSPNKMDQEIASAINRALLHQLALAHIRIMNAGRYAKSAIMAIIHQNPTVEMAL